MKIALLGPSHPLRGGIVHFNSRLATALKDRKDWAVDLFYWAQPYPTFLLPGSATSFSDDQSKLTFHLPGAHFLSYTDPLSWITLIQRLRRGRYDIFITHWVHPVHLPVFYFLFAAIRRWTHTKVCLIVQNCLPHEPLPGAVWMARTIFKSTDNLITHSASEARQARDIGMPAAKIIKAYHPISDQFVIPTESRDTIRQRLGLRSKVLLFFGFIRPYKGLDCLLEAFLSLAPDHPELSLLIVGNDFFRKQGQPGAKDRFLGRLAPDHPVRDQIVWHDHYVPNELVSQYFEVADALVAPYLSVTQSGPVQVAYAFSKPVIASDLPGFRECVRHGRSGYLFEPGNPKDLADTISLFLDKPVDTLQVDRFRQRFSWNGYVELLCGSIERRKPL